MVDDGDIRIGTHERERALAALAEHHAAGRLDANEYEDRRGRATDAVTRREVAALFDDLPEPRPDLTTASTVRAERPTDEASRPRRRLGSTLAALAPFVGIGAFFLTREWIALLLIPIIAIIAKNLDR